MTDITKKFTKNDKIKVKMPSKGWVIGKIQFTKTLNDGRTFYYIKPERIYKDGQIRPAKGLVNEHRLMCIPAYVKDLVSGASQ